MERRNFIKNTCIYCLGATALGATFAELMSCSTSGLPIYKTGEVKNILVPLSLFAQSKVVVVRPSTSEFDILVVKKADNLYNAFLMECTHRENPLTATNTGLYCPAHGSRFDLDGNVTQGPATEPLQYYKVIINGDNAAINII